MARAGVCLYCERRPIASSLSPDACEKCLKKEVDSSVLLLPNKVARCGHLSFNYFKCRDCVDPIAEYRNDLEGLYEQLRTWDPEKGCYKAKRGAAGDAWRSFPRLMHARGYTYNKRTGNYQVRFKTKHVGTAGTAEEARQMYLKRVEEYRNEVAAISSGPDHQVQESEVLQLGDETVHVSS